MRRPPGSAPRYAAPSFRQHRPVNLREGCIGSKQKSRMRAHSGFLEYHNSADELIGQDAFAFGALDFIAHFDDFQRKCFGFILKRTGHCHHPKYKIRAALRHTLRYCRSPKQSVTIGADGEYGKGRVAESNFCGTPLLQTNQEKNGGIASKSNQPKPKTTSQSQKRYKKLGAVEKQTRMWIAFPFCVNYETSLSDTRVLSRLYSRFIHSFFRSNARARKNSSVRILPLPLVRKRRNPKSFLSSANAPST